MTPSAMKGGTARSPRLALIARMRAIPFDPHEVARQSLATSST